MKVHDDFGSNMEKITENIKFTIELSEMFSNTIILVLI